MDNRAIGVFDSGLGGLTCVREIMNILPGENVVYFGDTGRVPYGSRSEETIKKYVKSDIGFLLTHPVKIIVAACGTASAVALEELKETCSVPLIGVVEPAAEAAYRATKNGRIGVIGTSGTIKKGKYEEFLLKKDGNISVFSKACPIFVPIVENGFADHEIAYLACREYLGQIRSQGIDTLILGCTHYPIMKKAIADTMGDGVTLIDPGAEVARYLKTFLEENGILSQRGGNYKYCVSDGTADFEKMAGMFLNRDISGIAQKIDIEKF